MRKSSSSEIQKLEEQGFFEVDKLQKFELGADLAKIISSLDLGNWMKNQP